MRLHKDVRELVERAEEMGYSAERTNGGHLKFIHPMVEKPIFCPSTPSEYRSLKNCESLLTRAVNDVANRLLKEDISLGEKAAHGATDPEGHACPACEGNGIKKTFVHPQGLVAHMAKEHPAPALEIEEWNQEFEDQPEEDMATEPEQPQEEPKPVRVSELEEYLEGLFEEEELEPGDVITLAQLRDGFSGRDVLNAITSLKKRDSGTRLEHFGSARSGKYVFFSGEPPVPDLPVPAGFEESRIFEEINRFVDGRVLLRDTDGNLYQAEIEPLA